MMPFAGGPESLANGTLLLSVAAAALYLPVQGRAPSLRRSLVKTAATALLAVLAFIEGGPWLLVAALALGAAGDFFLSRDGEEMDRGVAGNVLGGPLPALRHFVAGLAGRPMARGIEPGDLVTTGTVTRAFPVVAGETWTSRLEGLPLPGMRLAFR